MSKIKKIAWVFILPLHDTLRDFLLYLNIIKYVGRQDYFIGWLHPDHNIEDFILHLKLQGFDDKHFASWTDKGELIDLRLLESFDFQYHVRIFHDREIRGHYEITPESHPIQHLMDKYTEPRMEKFMEWMGQWITQDTELFGGTPHPTVPRLRRVTDLLRDNDANQ